MNKFINRIILGLTLTIAIWTGLSYSGQVQAAPPGRGNADLTPAEVTAMLDAHNSWRLRFSVTPLVWDNAVAAVAQDWANQVAATGVFAHRPNNAFGENIWGGTSGFFVPTDAVNSWGNEVENYDFATNTCAAGKACGHFTQVVWARTLKVGCGKATGNGNDYYVCNYDPPGNFVGQTTGASPAAALSTVQPTEAPIVATQPTAAQPTATETAAVPPTATTAPIKGTTGLDPANATVLLDAHNALREKFNVPLLVWDDTVAAFAQGWSDQIAAAGGNFSTRAGNHFGVNFFFGTTGGSPANAVNWWGNSAADFDVATNTCAAGKNCNAFTQVIWGATTKVGCGKTTANGNDYYICNYDPAGNVQGQNPGASLVSKTNTPTATQTATFTATATETATVAATTAATETLTPTTTPTETATSTPTVVGTATMTPTENLTTTSTPTFTLTATPTQTHTATATTAAVNTATPTRALNGTTGLTAADANSMLDAHNSWRMRFNVPALSWDDAVAAVAQNWADRLAATDTFEHRPNNQFGENIWSGSSGFFLVTDAVNGWGNEVDDYDFATNTCAAGKACGHFTQLVWANTTSVGCGKATGNGNDYIVCNYNPPGNLIGERPGASPAVAPVIALPTDAPTATPPPAAVVAPNVDPAAALAFDTPNQVIPGSAALWYTVPAPAGGADVTIRVPQGAVNALGFWVFSASQMADLANATHIGTGNAEGDDLVWTGNSFEDGPYFIVVFNNTIVDVPFTIQAQ